MAAELKGKKVAIIATDGVEQVELEKPRKAVEDAGAEADWFPPAIRVTCRRSARR